MTVKARGIFGGASVVIAANEVNLSIFKPLWFAQTNLLRPEELSGDCIISPAAIQIPTSRFNLLILPDRLQMVFAEMDEATVVEPLNRVLGGILKNLPHTPILGIGINFDFFVGPNDLGRFIDWNKELFASNVALALGSNPEDRPKYGSYYSMNFQDMRLKMNVRPIKGAIASPKVVEQLRAAAEWMHFNFNYHVDLSQSGPTDHAIGILSKWDSVAAHARSIISSIPG